MIANAPLFRKLDNLLLRVADLDAAIAFYRDRLGHRVLWRSGEAVGFALPDTDAELVVHLHIGPETDVVVEDVDRAFALFLSAGGEAVEPPFDIAIGRCARSRSLRQPIGHPGQLQRPPRDRRRRPSDRGQAAFARIIPAPRIEIPSCARANVLQMFS
jgi:catechol 2,3-dioxygenase-like lactoylglutathione lyase family enzyme